jgi:alpha-acetolactate decarboxylase
MSKTRWAVDGADGEVIELNGRKFSTNDDGAPMLVRTISASDRHYTHVV